MGYTLHTHEEIRNALLTVGHATLAAQNAHGGCVDPYTQGYQEGVQQALIAVALALGLVPLPTYQGAPWSAQHAVASTSARGVANRTERQSFVRAAIP